MFNFDIKNTSVYQSVKIERFFIFRFAEFFKNIFFYLFIAALLSFVLVLFDYIKIITSLRLIFVFAALYLIFYELYLFLNFKIKSVSEKSQLDQAVANFEQFNIAQFLSFDACKAVEDAIKFCKRRRIEINSVSLLYALSKKNKDVMILFYRLGLNSVKLQSDIKNYIEKMQKQQRFSEVYADNFQRVIIGAVKIAVERKRSAIGEKEILVSLAHNDEFFKKVMMDSDLKDKDIENITLWLDSVERVLDLSKKFWTYENLSKYGSIGKDWASGYTVTLDQYSIDWRRVVSKWMYREIIGNEKEIEQAQMVLARSNLSNVLLVGDPGVGRKSIVQAIAQKCFLGTSLPELNNKRVVELDMISLLSQIQDFEKLELTLNQIFQEVVAAGNVVLVIDELHNFIGERNPKPGVVDISGILTKYLAIPSFQFIGITTFDGLHQKIEQNSSFLQYLRKIEVAEVTEQETIRILQSFALELEQKYKILVTYPAIREIVNLTGRYFPSTPFPKKALDALDETVVYVETIKEKIVMPSHVAKIISEKTEIPVGKMEFKEKEVLLNLEKLIHERLVNQSEAVREVSIAMRRARAGIASKKRPMGTFLFLGPTGVGKTETAKALSQIYFGSEEKMIRIDMSEFQSLHDIPRLIGAVSPVEMQGLLTTPVRETPFSLVLLDEIEKAHPNILNLFLQVLDEGHITDGQGRKVVFSNTIIICTTNAGAESIFKAVEANEKLDKQKILNKIFEDNIFRPEFVNRFDATVVFSPLTKENLLDIAQLMLNSLKKNLQEKEINFEITEDLKQKIVELSYKPEFGAREMRRVVQDNVENAIAEALISDKIQKGDIIQINAASFEVVKTIR